MARDRRAFLDSSVSNGCRSAFSSAPFFARRLTKDMWVNEPSPATKHTAIWSLRVKRESALRQRLEDSKSLNACA